MNCVIGTKISLQITSKNGQVYKKSIGFMPNCKDCKVQKTIVKIPENYQYKPNLSSKYAMKSL